jgi:hypothetical protein
MLHSGGSIYEGSNEPDRFSLHSQNEVWRAQPFSPDALVTAQKLQLNVICKITRHESHLHMFLPTFTFLTNQ